MIIVDYTVDYSYIVRVIQMVKPGNHDFYCPWVSASYRYPENEGLLSLSGFNKLPLKGPYISIYAVENKLTDNLQAVSTDFKQQQHCGTQPSLHMNLKEEEEWRNRRLQ